MKKVNPLFAITSFVIMLLGVCFLPSCTSDKTAEKGVNEEAAPKVVRSRLRAEPDMLSPVFATRAQTLQVVNLLFPMLLTHDPVTYELSPVLAKSRPDKQLLTEAPYEDGVAYTYEIRPEAVWDDGKAVTGHDYAFTMKALFNPMVKATAYQGILNFIKDVKVDESNPKRFTVYCNQTFRSEFVSGFYVYPEHIYDPEHIMQKFELISLTNTDLTKQLQENEDIKKFADFFNAQGTPGTIIESCGPYKLVEWETGQRLILEKKKNWWGDKLVDEVPMLKTYPEEIIFTPIPDDMAAVTAMKGGQIDVAGKVNANMFLEFKESESGKDFQFHNPEILFFNYMGLNTKRSKFEDKNVRRALAHLVDVDELIETVQLGMAIPVTSPFPINTAYTNDKLPRISFDIEKAKVLLEEAGWKDSDSDGIVDKVINGKKTPFNMTIAITDSEVSKNNVAIIKEDAIKAGIAIEAEIVTPRQLFGEVLPQRNFDAFLLASGFDLGMYDPIQFWHTSSDTPSGSNRFGFGNSETDAIIEEIRRTQNESRRKELYFQLQKIIYDEQPVILLNAPRDRIVIRKDFKNVKTTLRSPGYTESLFH